MDSISATPIDRSREIYGQASNIFSRIAGTSIESQRQTNYYGLGVKALNELPHVQKKFFPVRTFERRKSFGCNQPFVGDRGSHKFFAEIKGQNRPDDV